MPTILKLFGYIFGFFSEEGNERPHVHVRPHKNPDAAEAKFWLNPVELVKIRGFKLSEVRKMQRTVEDYEDEFYEKWTEHFQKDG